MLRIADLATVGRLRERARQAAAQIQAQHVAAAEKHNARWLGSKAEFLKA